VRVLHLTPELPYAPGGGGGETREFYLLRRLVELGHDVENVSPLNAVQAENTHLLAEAGVALRARRRPDSPIEEVLRAASREPAGVIGAAFSQPFRAWGERVIWTSLRRLAQEAIDERRPDVVLIGHDMSMAWARDLPPEIPKLLSCHNLSWHLYASRARLASGPRAWALRAEAARYKAHVLRELPRFSTAIAVSTKERDELVEIGLTHTAFIPSGVGTEVITPAPEPTEGPPRLLFTGTMNYGPNSEGIGWFAREVWPLVRAEVPEAQVDVVGRNPPESVKRLDAIDGITVHGGVPEMAPYFAASNAVIVPILTGAGIRVKIVEAMAAGRAWVSTPLGAEGLELEPGRHGLVVDGPRAFADGVIALLRDPELRARIGREGRALAERRYDWRALGDELEATLAEAVARVR
jgi:glycosyltransferase involved in cell wall biosynthesis